MTKEFVPYELAVKLKALGFDEPCLKTMLDFDITYESDVKMPLYQQAFRWFREKHNLYHSIDTRVSKDIGYYIFLNDEEIYDDSCYWNYEEAELACLNKLIEIVETEYK